MAKTFRTNVLEAGLTVDPTAGAGVVAPIGSIIPRRGTTELWQKFGAADTDWQLLPASGAGSGIVVWSLAKSWADVYTEILSFNNEPVICLVEWDDVTALPRLMTNEAGAGFTQLNDVRFIGISSVSFGGVVPIPIIEVADGVTLPASGVGPTTDAILSSTNIFWQVDATTTPLTTDGNVVLSLDGGGLSTPGGGQPAFDSPIRFYVQLTNTAYLGNGPLVVNNDVVGSDTSINMISGVLGTGSFADGTFVELTYDASSEVPSNAFVLVNPPTTSTFADIARQVEFSDQLATETPTVNVVVGAEGSLRAEQVQAAIDSLKFMTSPEHRRSAWSAGTGPIVVLIATDGLFDPTIAGTLAAPTTVATNQVTATFRRSVTSAAGANSAAEIAGGNVYLRSAFAGYGGFKLVLRFAPAVTIPANNRGFFGFTDSAAVLAATTVPVNLLNNFGFAWETGQTNFRFQHNDGAGASTTINLGADFPTNDATVLMTAQIICLQNDPVVYYWLKNETNQVIVSGSVNSDLPAIGTPMVPHFHTNNGGTASATRWDFAYSFFYM